jgi:hypothetical protein
MMKQQMSSPVLCIFYFIYLITSTAQYCVAVVFLSGPDGNYDGVPCKLNWYRYQRVLYTWHIHGHGLKIETAHLPNGIGKIYGSFLAQPADAGRVLQMSGLDFFSALHINNPVIYSVFGDGAYKAGYVRCIRSWL